MFIKLAASANPNTIEQLWAPILTDSVSGLPAISADGQLLLDNRQAFLSTRILDSYGGYARSQLRKAQAGSGGSRGVKHFKREKFILHLYRLFEQGLSFLRTGEMCIRIADPERMRAQARQPLERVQNDFDNLAAELLAAAEESTLPQEPDWTRINSLLREIRYTHLTDII
jgi:hypothetical protein